LSVAPGPVNHASIAPSGRALRPPLLSHCHHLSLYASPYLCVDDAEAISSFASSTRLRTRTLLHRPPSSLSTTASHHHPLAPEHHPGPVPPSSRQVTGRCDRTSRRAAGFFLHKELTIAGYFPPSSSPVTTSMSTAAVH
jgi:hypothetical protein